MRTGIAFWLGVFTGAVVSIIAIHEETENAEREFRQLVGGHSRQSAPKAERPGSFGLQATSPDAEEEKAREGL